MLEKKAKADGAADQDNLDLALYYIEPFHREEDARTLLENLVTSPSVGIIARIWLAYLAIHHFMNASSLLRAGQLLQALLSDRSATDEYRSAAHLLLAQIIAETRGWNAEEVVDHLLQSIALAPDWITSHQLLAWALSARGKSDQAAVDLRRAIANVREGHSPATDFHVSISGKSAHGVMDRLAEQLDELESA